MILIIDNYDSFTYNLVQYLGELGADVVVSRNDEITIDEIKKMQPEKIMIDRIAGNNNFRLFIIAPPGLQIIKTCDALIYDIQYK